MHHSVEDSIDSTPSTQTNDDLHATGQAESSENSRHAGQTGKVAGLYDCRILRADFLYITFFKVLFKMVNMFI